MNDLLDFIKNPKDREDFFIALIVIAFFGFGILYYTFPKENPSDSLTEYELADHLNQSLSDGTLESKIFTDLETADIEELNAIKTESTKASKKIKKDNKLTSDSEAKNKIIVPQKDLDKAINKDVDEKAKVEAELYDKTQKEEIITATETEKANQLENDTKIIDKENAAKLKAIEEQKLAEAEAKKAAELRAIEEQKIAEAKKAAELKSAIEAEKAAKLNEEAKEEIKTSTTEYNKQDAKKTTPKKTITTPKTKASNTKSDCVIVVGAFKRAEGADLIIKKLKANNYKTTTGFIRGLKYVGVPINCSDNNDTIIKEINEKFEKEAWVLRR